MTQVRSGYAQIVLIAIVLAAAVLCAIFFMLTRPETKKRNLRLLPSEVEVVELEQSFSKAMVQSMGTVEPSKIIDLVAEVGGKVVWVSPKLVDGGRFTKNEPMLRIDKTDYEIALEQRKAELALADRDMLAEKGKAASAKIIEETSTIKSNKKARALRMRIPYLQAATANLAAAKMRLKQAELDLEKTELVAPFDLLVLAEDVEVGYFVRMESTVAEVVGTDEFWVRAAIPLQNAKMLNIPGINSDTGSKAIIKMNGSNASSGVREGEVIRLLGTLDKTGRMAKLIVTVKDPLGVKTGDKAHPLLINSFVDIELEGKDLAGCVRIPRKFIRENDTVWILGKENKLDIRSLEIVWEDRDSVYACKGVAAGDKIVITSGLVPVEGMTLSVAGDSKDHLGTEIVEKTNESQTNEKVE